MHVNRGLLNWGVFFLLLGAIPIAVRQGLIPEAAVARAWTLWPLLLVAAGIGLVLRRTRLEFVGGLISAATLGVIGGGLLASGGIPFGSCGDERDSVAFPARQGELAVEASVDVRLNCGELAIGTTVGNSWTLQGVDDDGSGPRIEAAGSTVKIESDDRPGFAFFGSRDRWTLMLGTDSRIDLATTLNAGEAQLVLADANLGELKVDVNAGKATIDLGAIAAITGLDVQVNAGEARIVLPNLALRGAVDANAGTVRLCAPAAAGLRLRMNDNITASNNFAERGLVETTKSVWETQGYASAGVQLEIAADVNAGGIDLEPIGTCGD
jgi:hypothetical protein